MRFLLSVLIATAATTATAASPNDVTQKPNPLKAEKKCANATSQYAWIYRGDPIRPKKLTELPPGETYAAVYRVVDGCAVPVLYREVRAVRPPKR